MVVGDLRNVDVVLDAAIRPWPTELMPPPDAEGIMVCPETGWRYQEVETGVLRCLDWPEDKELA